MRYNAEAGILACLCVFWYCPGCKVFGGVLLKRRL